MRLIHLLLFGLLAYPWAAGQAKPLYQMAMAEWEPDPFRLQIFHQEPLPDGLARILPELAAELQERPPSANLELEVIDLSTLSDDEKLAIPDLQQIRFWPAALLHPPESWPEAKPLVFGASETMIQRILHSPIRQRIRDELLTKTAAVWCLVESGDATADQQALKLLQESLTQIQDELAPPQGFSIERIRRDDPAEQTFLKILMGPTRRAITGPVFVPVFGRGRTLGPMPSSISSEARVSDTCREIVTSISDDLPDPLPGYDLLFSANWKARTPEPEPPQIIPSEPQPISNTPVDATVAKQEHSSTSRGFMAFLVGGGVLLLGILGIVSLKFRT